MSIRINLILIWVALVSSCIGYPFSSSNFEVTLSSNGTNRPLAVHHPFSCQLMVFEVFDDNYTLEIEVKEYQFTHVQVKFNSSNDCRVKQLVGKIANFTVLNTVYENNSFQVRQKYFIRVFNLSSSSESSWIIGNDCTGIEQNGEQRIVYLVSQTREENEGERHYIINIPKYAIGFTQITSLILLFLLSHNIKYRRFTPYSLNLLNAILYVAFLIFTVYIELILGDKINIFSWIIMGFSIIFMSFYFIDITSIFLHKTPVIIAISIVLALLIAVVDIFILTDAWFINDLIGVLVAGALIKFIVIKKLKGAVWPLLILWIFFIFRQFAVIFGFQRFQQALQIKIIPLFLQMPGIFGDDQTGFMCSAFGTSKIITMGLFMNYCVRVDLFLSSHFYSILCGVIAIISMISEYLILFFLDQLPVLEYTSAIIFLPVSMGLVLMFASKRGEWAELWHGSFHDIAVDRKSIKRDSSIIISDEVDNNLQQLKMNPSLLSNQ